MKAQIVGDLLKQAVRESLPKAFASSKWLLSIMLPVSFVVLLLNYSGVLAAISSCLTPAFELIGLPGESAFVLITSIFTNIYTAIAVITSLELHGRVVTILAVMCLVSHGFMIETTVLKKTGSSVIRMILLRLISSFVIGASLNYFLPIDILNTVSEIHLESQTFWVMFSNWLEASLILTIKVIVLITVLMIFQKILELFGIIKWISRGLKPLQVVMGLPTRTSFSWIVANTLGLAYGSAIIMEQVESGQMSMADADLLNHHIAISHSELEDPLLFAAIGVPLVWIIIPRVIWAIIVVWMRRLELEIRKKIDLRGKDVVSVMRS
ncbi:nucleoside recognition domain-containing protein [Ancylomarina longa]|uniref:Nucleoside recognition protein n=1 Tax=Ancylomarina longa TaxID=2487017 RepID=A0A434AXW8_9BACT|nr:nucleoside recognition domain-containing protein [Ancylomarina longa]RUT79281.1 nucleoside recognition protein [Ancylomarina longa]